MPQQAVKSASGIPMDANGVPMNTAWARGVNNTIIDIWARDKGQEVTKRIFTPKKGVDGQDIKAVSASAFALTAEGR